MFYSVFIIFCHGEIYRIDPLCLSDFIPCFILILILDDNDFFSTNADLTVNMIQTLYGFMGPYINKSAPEVGIK